MAELVAVEAMASDFQALGDPRHTCNRQHRLANSAVICVAVIIGGCDDPPRTHRWARYRADWLTERLTQNM